MITGVAVGRVLLANGLGTALGSRKRRLAIDLPEHGRRTATFASRVVVAPGLRLCCGKRRVAVAGIEMNEH